MARDKFDLLQKKSAGDAADPRPEQIKLLRASARNCIDTHNELVGQIWEIDHILAGDKGKVDKDLLTKKREALLAQMKNEGYEDKINRLLEDIKAKEIALYGHSDVGGSSPYKL